MSEHNCQTQLPDNWLKSHKIALLAEPYIWYCSYIVGAIAPFCAKKKKWTVSKQIRTSKLTMYACMQLSWHQCQLKIVLLWLYIWSRPCTRTAPEFLSGLDTKNRCVHTQISPCTFREHRTWVLCLDTKCEHSQRFNLFSQSNSAADPGEGPWGPGPPFCQTKLRPKGPKKMFWRLPPYKSQGLDAPPPPLSQGLDAALKFARS